MSLSLSSEEVGQRQREIGPDSHGRRLMVGGAGETITLTSSRADNCPEVLDG
jgi:hypothetical protein